ncbi:bidirectional sugar transporter SWEET7 [Striga asiatica]|uniref:Bidirectional sugar transporter SWEET7 n=1 Tax=Striga asiatica TaxID=4170 RepID=A0A5A7RCT7_STRAF|nr:bidirectional sugar transporter SWEET7 [Striga asiatica]
MPSTSAMAGKGILQKVDKKSGVTRFFVWGLLHAEFLPFWLCFAGFCNGVCWFSYAFLKKFDPYLAITNGLGGLFGLFQIIVYAYYTLRAKSNKGSSVGDGAKTSDEQLKKNYMASPA